MLIDLLDKATPVEAPSDDPATQAINSAKGRVVEALFSHALRECRLEDAGSGGHAAAWARMQPVFDVELGKCIEANYEFSTLAGNYVAQLYYMDSEWIMANIKRVFPTEYESNFICAIAGLAYASVNQKIYDLLVNNEVIDKAVRCELKGGQTRKQLIEKIALAFLWGDEELDSSRFAFLFDSNRVDDLEFVSWFFWTIKNKEMEQEQVARVLAFWVRCSEWVHTQQNKPQLLLSRLGLLSCYLSSIDDQGLRLLLLVAPYAAQGHNENQFIQELERLGDTNLEKVALVLDKFLETYKAQYDYEGHLLKLITKIAEGGLKLFALELVQKVRELPGMIDLYTRLISES